MLTFVFVVFAISAARAVTCYSVVTVTCQFDRSLIKKAVFPYWAQDTRWQGKPKTFRGVVHAHFGTRKANSNANSFHIPPNQNEGIQCNKSIINSNSPFPQSALPLLSGLEQPRPKCFSPQFLR